MIDTHYMYRPPVLDQVAFRDLVSDVRKIVAAAPSHIRVRGKAGLGDPDLADDRIALNGDLTAGQGHEPLIIEQTYSLKPPSRMRGDEFFDFCKTNGKPYDTVVVGILFAFAWRFPTCRIATDSDESELKPGFALFSRACTPPIDLASLFQRVQRART